MSCSTSRKDMILNHKSHMLRRALVSTPARHNSAGEARSQCIQTNSSFDKFHSQTHSINDTGDSAAARWSSSSGASGHRGLKTWGKTQFRKCVLEQTLPKVSSGHRRMDAEPTRERYGIAKTCSTPSTHPGLSLRNLLKKSPGGKQELSVHVSFSLWRIKPFYFAKGSGRCQHWWAKCLWDCCGNWVPWSFSLFHRKENLGCGSGLPASLEHAIFCPGRLETRCLGQKSVSAWLSG